MWYTVLITLVIDIGGLLLIYVLLRDRVRRAASSDAHIAEIRDEVSRLLVDLNRTTDRNIALIEDRITSLNELLASADKKIGLLHREIEKHDVGTQVYGRLAEARSRFPGTLTQDSRPRREPDESLRQSPDPMEMPRERAEEADGAGTLAPGAGAQPRQTARGGRPLAVELSEAPESGIGGGHQSESLGREEWAARRQEQHRVAQPRQERDQMPQSRQERDQMPQPRQEREGAAGGAAIGGAAAKPPDLQQRVVMLHNAGFAASLIASRVGVPLGEVELIIALQERKGRT